MSQQLQTLILLHAQLVQQYDQLGQTVSAITSLINTVAPSQPQPMAFNAAPIDNQSTLRVRIALWAKPTCLRGSFDVGDQKFDCVLFKSQPNSSSLLYNGYIIPANAERSDDQKISEIAVGSLFVNGSSASPVLNFKFTSPLLNELPGSMVLTQNTSDNPKAPQIVGETQVVGTLVKASVTQMAAPQQQQFTPPGQPTDGGILGVGAVNVSDLFAPTPSSSLFL